MKKALVHIRCNTGKVRRERRDGRDLMIVPSFTLKSGIVMNRIKYEQAEIEKGYSSFERTPAPLGHPTVNGKFVSASDPEGLSRSWVGSWNENVRREGDRIAMDKVIDVEQAKQLEGGKAILAAIDKGEAIHSSTGLFCMLEAVKDHDGYDFIAHDIVGDHDAWLIGEPGAATPDDGVGILVNAATGDEIPVINSSYEDNVEREMDWAFESIVRGFERKKQAGLIERIKTLISDWFEGDPTPDATGIIPNGQEKIMDKAQFDALSGEVKALSDTVAAIPETIATAVANALKPMTDAQAARDAADKEKTDAEHAALVNKVVEAGLLDEAPAKEATVAVLNALIEKNAPSSAIHVNRSYKPAAGKSAYTAPKGE